MNKPVVFMDFDGVLNFDASRNEYTRYGDTMGYLRKNDVYVDNQWYRLNWSSELVRKLMALKVLTGYQWRWLTTWYGNTAVLDRTLEIGSDTAAVWDPYGWKASGQTPQYSDFIQYRNHEKLRLVLKFADENPDTPFVWVDDEATALWEDFHSAEMKAPHLIVKPSSKFGLVKHEFNKIEKFLLKHS